MKVQYQADADLKVAIVWGTNRSEPSIDFQTALEAGLEGLPDPEVLAIAARDGRILLTHDHKTMPRHFSDFIANNTCPGVFVIPQHVRINVVIDELVLIWLASEAEEWINRICYLPL